MSKHIAHLTKVFMGGKLVPNITKLTLTAIPNEQQWKAEVTQPDGKQTLFLEKGTELRVDELYLGVHGEVNMVLVLFDANAVAKLEAARKEDADKVAAELKAQEDAKAKAQADEDARVAAELKEKEEAEAARLADEKALAEMALAEKDAKAKAELEAAAKVDPNMTVVTPENVEALKAKADADLAAESKAAAAKPAKADKKAK